MSNSVKVFFSFFLLELLISCSVSGGASLGGYSNAFRKSKNPNIIWQGKKEIKNKKERPSYVGHSDDKYIYCYGYKGRGRDASQSSFSIFSSSKKLPLYYKLDKNTLEVLESSKEIDQTKIEGVDGVFWTEKAGWLLYTEDGNKKRKLHFAKPVSLSEQKKSKLLFEIEVEKKNMFIKDHFGLSKDTSKFIYSALIYDSKKDEASFITYCFDFVTMAPLWKTNHTLPYKIKKKSDIAGIVWEYSEEGEIQFLMKHYFTRNKKESRKNEAGEKEANYVYDFFVLNKNGSVEQYEVNNEGAYVRDIEFVKTESTNPIICGYTFDKTRMKELTGIMFKQIDRENKKVNDLISLKMKAKKIEAENEETGKKIKQQNVFQKASILSIRGIVSSKTDNSTFVIGENNSYYERCYTNRSTGTEVCIPYVRSGNMLITRISEDGEEAWTITIPKSQNVPLADIHSFAYYEEQGSLHLFFNDHSDNYKKNAPKRIKVWAGSRTSFIHTIVRPDGKYEMIESLGRKDHPTAVYIGSIRKLDEESVLIQDRSEIGRLKIDK